MNRRTITVVTAGLGSPSSTRLLADRLAGAAARALGEHDIDVEIEVIELRDHAHDQTNRLLTGFATEDLGAAMKKVVEADGLIAVTPIFNASYSGLFKTFFDVLEPDALAGKPVLIAATAGTARHSLAIEHAVRPLFSYLRALVVPTGVFAASEDWGAGGRSEHALSERIDRAARELAGLIATAGRSTPGDPFDDLTSFEDLLAVD